MNQVQNFSIVYSALKYMKLTMRCAEERVFKLQSLLGKVYVFRYWKTKVQETKSVAEGQIKGLG